MPHANLQPPTTERDINEAALFKKVIWRIIPFLMVCYFISYVDRVNAGFAALQMNKDVGLSHVMFGFGGGLFFIAYILFEIPSNLAMQKFGARVWIARIMITWGLVSAANAFIVGPNSYYVIRFLLGAAEAGFFPCVILYLTYWFPVHYRSRIVAIFMVAVPVSSMLGSPLSAFLLGLEGLGGLRGWQLVFLLEAIPAVILGIALLSVLPNSPQNAKWLTLDEKEWLISSIESSGKRAAHVKPMSLLKILSNKTVLALAIIYSGTSATSNALSLWQPQILKSFGLTNIETGLLNAVPFAIASIGMIVWGRRADKTGERKWSTALPLIVTALSLLATQTTDHLVVTMVLLTLTLVGNYAASGPFWALATETLSVSAAAVGIAAINTLSHIGTFCAIWLLGYIKDQTGSYPLALIPLVVLTGVGVLLTLKIGQDRNEDAGESLH